MKFPNECTQCGACCLFEVCLIGVMTYGVDKKGKCPALIFREETAICGLVPSGGIPIGDGCCIKARAYKDDVEYDFASLPKEKKLLAVKQIRRIK